MNVFQEIYEIVKNIPKGKVATYGQVATMTGNPRRSRVVGYALHANPNPDEIPCFRVVDRMGRTSGSFAFGGSDEQRRLLELDGIVFEADGTVDLVKYQWNGEIGYGTEI